MRRPRSPSCRLLWREGPADPDVGLPGRRRPQRPPHHHAHTNGKGFPTRYLINNRLQVIRVTDALGNTTRTTYDTDDRPLQITDPLGNTTHRNA
ncbi:hypothetical protein [Streptomyces sp. NPDC050355]|uniref:hypothetical protein n=1 Tax=Streptomyces sp. NPDC050355 TaxID=3365609 RepID=UPI0037AAA541